MRAVEPQQLGELLHWQSLVVEAAAEVIEFWGFKANHGRVWALAYLAGTPLTAAEIGRALGLSKGAISMVTREMGQWGVLHCVRGRDVRRYSAETDFVGMIGHVLETREARLISRTKQRLERAEQLARELAPPEAAHRVARLHSLARLVERAVFAFLSTARLDVTRALGILGGSSRPALRASRLPASQVQPRKRASQ
jgi:DNA-binding transcriptional regulator GbsR (MarR family)